MESGPPKKSPPQFCDSFFSQSLLGDRWFSGSLVIQITDILPCSCFLLQKGIAFDKDPQIAAFFDKARPKNQLGRNCLELLGKWGLSVELIKTRVLEITCVRERRVII